MKPKVPTGIWVLGFVSMLMDISSEMIHRLLPLFMVGTLGASESPVSEKRTNPIQWESLKKLSMDYWWVVRGTAYGFFNLVSGIAMLVASIVAGLVWEKLGASFTFFAGAVFCGIALLGLLRPRTYRMVKS